MKKWAVLLMLSALMLLVISGCSEKRQGAAPSEPQSSTSSRSASSAIPEESEAINSQLPSAGSLDVDIDLTAMSSTMVFAEVSNIMWEPEQYVGKTFKVRGEYTSIYYQDTGEDYHAVIIADALACCAQGLDFVWTGEHVYPDDYPEQGTEIEISGVFQMVQEGEYYYIYIETDEIVVVS